MLDANLNRAKEGLRVAEDTARFVLNDHDLAGMCRNLRHRLHQNSQAWPVSHHAIIAERDTNADTAQSHGVRSATPRDGLADLVGSSMSRAAEALRCIEDVMRLIDAGSENAAAIEQLRFASYDIAKLLMVRLPTGRTVQHRLYVLITQRLCVHHSWIDVLKLSVEAGATAIQLREKEMCDIDRISMGRRAREWIDAQRPETELWMNDRPDIAAVVGVTGVHLGQTDMPTPDARRVLQPRQAVGRTVSSYDEANEAVAHGADMLGIGAMFQTTSKASPTVRGPSLLTEVNTTVKLDEIPHVAIGGITPENVSAVMEAGARGVAVTSCVCAAKDPGSVCAQLIEKMSTPRCP